MPEEAKLKPPGKEPEPRPAQQVEEAAAEPQVNDTALRN
jgi:hypothetical protein